MQLNVTKDYIYIELDIDKKHILRMREGKDCQFFDDDCVVVLRCTDYEADNEEDDDE